jgi:branched-chain amino acid transport system permease protein
VTEFLGYTVVGLVVGSVYAIAASGLVVTYTTSGIFNFAHGAIGMVSAFAYWEATERHDVSAIIALPLVVGVLAPALGVLVERLVVRRLRHAPVEVTLVVTLGLLLALLYGSYVVWDPTTARPLPRFFGDRTVSLVGVNVSYHQIIVVLAAIAVALALRFLLVRTRIGLAMRAVVDDPELTALTAADPDRVTAISWALGASLAALAGVLVAPLVVLDALALTLLVVNSYAAAMFGRLRSLPMTFAGGVALGLIVTYATGYLPQNEISNRLRDGLPTFTLFAVLLLLPAARISTAGSMGDRRPLRAPGPLRSAQLAAAFVVVVGVLALRLPTERLGAAGDVLALGVILLSLVLLTGYGGYVSLCQLTFAGVGALAVGKLGASPAGFVVAVGASAALGALVALPALRVRGLYLALATLAIARFFETVVFTDPRAFGVSASLRVDRLHIGPIDFGGERVHFVLLGFAFAAVAWVVLAVRRSAFGRRLAALGDSPAACVTFGIDAKRSKLIVFAASAAIAGLGGALLGGLHKGVGVNDFTMLGSVSLLMVVALGGLANVSGAILGSALLGVIAAVKPNVSENARRVLEMGPGLVVVYVLALMPDGIAGACGRLRDLLLGAVAVGEGGADAMEDAGEPAHAAR